MEKKIKVVKTFKQIGVVGVDSGTLMIIDPCYVEDNLEKWNDGLCDKVINLTDNEKQAGQMNYKKGHEGLAVVFNSGMGDGLYPVYAHYQDDRITKIEIVF